MRAIFVALIILFSPSLWANINIITTTSDLAAIAKTIGGDKVSVTSLTKGTRDPHYAQAKPSMIRKLFRADLLVLVGAEMEVGWLPALIRSSRNKRVLPNNEGYLDISKVIDLKGKPGQRVTRDMGDVHGAGNPHYWLDPSNGILMAKAIADRFGMLDPANKAVYSDNFAEFKLQLEQKIVRWKSELQRFSGEKILAYHTSLLYLSTAFNLDVRGYIEPQPGLSPSASHLNRLLKKIESENIRYILMEPYYETRSAKLLQRKTNINLVIIPQSVGSQPQIKSYFDLFDSIVNALKAVQ